jgi:hypothetical protein
MSACTKGNTNQNITNGEQCLLLLYLGEDGLGNGLKLDTCLFFRFMIFVWLTLAHWKTDMIQIRHCAF